MDIHYGHHGNETSRKAVLSIHECHWGDFFHHLRELTPDCGVSIRTSRTICRFMNIHYGNHGNDMHRLFLWQPFTLTQNIPARQLVSKAVVRCLGETLRVCLRNWSHLIRGTLGKKLYVSFFSSQIIVSTVTLHVFGVPTRASSLSAH